MRAWCRIADADTTAAALEELAGQIGADAAAGAVFAFYGCGHDAAAIHELLHQRFPNAAVIGGSSHDGVMDAAGARGANAIGLLVIEDPEGDYGAASAEIGDDPAAAAEAALTAALDAAGCPGELPELVWIYQAPGREEQTIEGLRRVVGDRCPIIGGSSADQDLSGAWSQLGPAGAHRDGIAVAALFPSRGVSYAFQGGYVPDGHSGLATRLGSGQATRTSGDGASRVIEEIDGEPAAVVYNRWIGGAIEEQLAEGGVILDKTTMTPLAIEAGKADGVEQYLLVHPDRVTREGALIAFAEVDDGVRLHCMKGDVGRLIERSGRVAALAVRQLEHGAPAAALMVFCAGCRIAVGDRIAEAPAMIQAALGDTPFLACFTYGEQGALLGRNAHGNLMISAIVFGS